MAWNPSPEVKVARDAATAMETALGDKIGRISQCVVFYRTADGGWLGFASYGDTKSECRVAGKFADWMYDRICKIVAGVDDVSEGEPQMLADLDPNY